MKLKYYLRGLGVGIVLTAVIMGVILGRRGSDMSDEEIIKRAKQLGMVEAESTLSSYSDSAKNPEVTDETNDTASDQKVDKTGEEVSEEVHEGESQTGESVPEMDKETQENGTTGENSESVKYEEDVKLASADASETASTEVIGAEEKSAEQTVEKSEEKTEAKTEAKIEEKIEEQNTEQAASDSGNTVENNQEKTTLEDISTMSASVADTTTAASDTTSSTAASSNTAESSSSASTEAPSQTNYIVVDLPSGSESDTCARILRESGVIEDGVAFNKYLVKSGLDRKIRSGTKQIPKGASFEEIASIITK